MLEKGYEVDLFDHSTGLAKKFLVAGKGGLNLTHSEEIDVFSTRYFENASLFRELLHDFSCEDLRSFCERLGVTTFIGTSGRVFPSKLKAAEMLINWRKLLSSYPGFSLFKEFSLKEMTKDKELTFIHRDQLQVMKYDKVILALGGGSWKNTGSDGQWIHYLKGLGIEIAPLRPMNCGFGCEWSDYFKKNIERAYLKNIILTFKDNSLRAEMVLTSYGVEGTAIYAISNLLRNEIEEKDSAKIFIDLKPDLSLEEIQKRFDKKKPKESLTTFMKKSLKLDRAAIDLLNEQRENINAQKIKSFEVVLNSIRPIDEAISTSGGIRLSGLTDHFESKKIKGLYFCGEMLDFEAPTGGYLLQGCFSTAYRVCQSF